MKLKTLMVITSIIGLLFGLSFFFAPVWTEASYGVNLDMGGQYIGRLLGSVFLGLYRPVLVGQERYQIGNAPCDRRKCICHHGAWFDSFDI